MTPPPINRPMPSIEVICRWFMKAAELIRLMWEAGYDPDEQLLRLHGTYNTRRDTARIRLDIAADEEKPR